MRLPSILKKNPVTAMDKAADHIISIGKKFTANKTGDT